MTQSLLLQYYRMNSQQAVYFQTRLLAENVDMLLPFLVQLFDHYLSVDYIPASFKGAYTTLVLKKPSLDQADQKLYVWAGRHSIGALEVTETFCHSTCLSLP